MGFLLYFGGHSHSHGDGSKKHKHSHDNNSGVSLNALFRRNDQPHENADDRTPLLSNAATPIIKTLEVESNSFHLKSEKKNLKKINSEENINVRAAFIHVLGDLIQSVGVLLAALLILWNVSIFFFLIIIFFLELMGHCRSNLYIIVFYYCCKHYSIHYS